MKQIGCVIALVVAGFAGSAEAQARFVKVPEVGAGARAEPVRFNLPQIGKAPEAGSRAKWLSIPVSDARIEVYAATLFRVLPVQEAYAAKMAEVSSAGAAESFAATANEAVRDAVEADGTMSYAEFARLTAAKEKDPELAARIIAAARSMVVPGG